MFSFDYQCLYKNNKPWFPFMGEIHYSRLPEKEWRDELLKMKAGGVTVVSSYSFWIHHEEGMNEWDFSGCRNLKLFLETVKSCGLYMIMRIGPWVHGEARNGGFPDWLLKSDCKPRTNDSDYFKYVKRYYEQLFNQAKGLLHKDGGPVIGVQIDNEFGHCGGLTGEEGEKHMRTLTQMAKEIGFDVPYYTATGWNGAITAGLLPVMGGYCDAPWEQGITETAPSGNYIFSFERNDTSIGSDHGLGHALSYDMNKFPYLTAELGGGLQGTKHRRVIPTTGDIAAMSIAKLGSGCNLLGYYMYHGGVNPTGKYSSLQESIDSGGYNDMPELSYDYRSPLGAYGQYYESYKELKLLSLFAADFGETLCKMPVYLPQDNPINPKDKEHFRYSFRHNGSWGYLFFNNHVRHMLRPDFSNINVTVPEINLTLPSFDAASGQYGFYPFNMPVHGGCIKFALAAPLCTINTTTVLYGTQMDATGDVLLISKDDALNAYKIKGTKEYLVLSDNPVIHDGNNLCVFASSDIQLKIYPAPDFSLEGFEHIGLDGVFAVYEKKLQSDTSQCIIEQISDKRYRLHIKGLSLSAHDYYCNIFYTAESAKAFTGGQFIMDDFYSDGKWCIGLRRHSFPTEIDIELNPLHSSTPIYLEAWPPMADGTVCRLDRAELTTIHNIKTPFTV